jgi:hypothetical protein
MTTTKTEIHLGDTARDTITGFQGTVVARTEWLYGCRRIVIQPNTLHEGKPIENMSFDEPQCELVHRAGAAVQSPELRKTGGPRPEPVRGR